MATPLDDAKNPPGTFPALGSAGDVMAQTNKAGTTKRSQTGSIKEGGLPKDRKTAEGGDNRRGSDADGNRAARRPKAARD
jgi:hypothetical protein